MNRTCNKSSSSHKNDNSNMISLNLFGKKDISDKENIKFDFFTDTTKSESTNKVVKNDFFNINFNQTSDTRSSSLKKSQSEQSTNINSNQSNTNNSKSLFKELKHNYKKHIEQKETDKTDEQLIKNHILKQKEQRSTLSQSLNLNSLVQYGDYAGQYNKHLQENCNLTLALSIFNSTKSSYPNNLLPFKEFSTHLSTLLKTNNINNCTIDPVKLYNMMKNYLQVHNSNENKIKHSLKQKPFEFDPVQTGNKDESTRCKTPPLFDFDSYQTPPKKSAKVPSPLCMQPNRLETAFLETGSDMFGDENSPCLYELPKSFRKDTKEVVSIDRNLLKKLDSAGNSRESDVVTGYKTRKPTVPKNKVTTSRKRLFDDASDNKELFPPRQSTTTKRSLDEDFGNASSLSKKFKNKTVISPNEYRIRQTYCPDTLEEFQLLPIPNATADLFSTIDFNLPKSKHVSETSKPFESIFDFDSK